MPGRFSYLGSAILSKFSLILLINQCNILLIYFNFYVNDVTEKRDEYLCSHFDNSVSFNNKDTIITHFVSLIQGY